MRYLLIAFVCLLPASASVLENSRLKKILEPGYESEIQQTTRTQKPQPIKEELISEEKGTITTEEVQIKQESKDNIEGVPEIQTEETGKQDSYAVVLSKSIKTIENDPWQDAAANLDEVVRFFANEKKISNNKSTGAFYQIALALHKFTYASFAMDSSVEPDYKIIKEEFINSKSIAKHAVNAAIRAKIPSQDLIINTDKILNKFIHEEVKYIDSLGNKL